MPRRPLLQAAACTDATPHPRRGHRRTTSCTSRSAPSPDNRTAHRQATRPDTSAPGPRSPFIFLPSAHLVPPFYACLSQVYLARPGRIRPARKEMVLNNGLIILLRLSALYCEKV